MEKLEFSDIFEKTEGIDAGIKSIESELDIPTIHVDVNLTFDAINSEGDKEDFTKDVAYVRTKLLHSIAKADNILNSLIKLMVIDDQLMAMNEPPKGFHRYYEVSTQLLKSISDASKELISLHTQNLKIRKEMDIGTKTDKPEEKVNTKMSIQELLKKAKEARLEDNGTSENSTE